MRSSAASSSQEMEDHPARASAPFWPHVPSSRPHVPGCETRNPEHAVVKKGDILSLLQRRKSASLSSAASGDAARAGVVSAPTRGGGAVATRAAGVVKVSAAQLRAVNAARDQGVPMAVTQAPKAFRTRTLPLGSGYSPSEKRIVPAPQQEQVLAAPLAIPVPTIPQPLGFPSLRPLTTTSILPTAVLRPDGLAGIPGFNGVFEQDSRRSPSPSRIVPGATPGGLQQPPSILASLQPPTLPLLEPWNGTTSSLNSSSEVEPRLQIGGSASSRAPTIGGGPIVAGGPPEETTNSRATATGGEPAPVGAEAVGTEAKPRWSWGSSSSDGQTHGVHPPGGRTSPGKAPPAIPVENLTFQASPVVSQVSATPLSGRPGDPTNRVKPATDKVGIIPPRSLLFHEIGDMPLPSALFYGAEERARERMRHIPEPVRPWIPERSQHDVAKETGAQEQEEPAPAEEASPSGKAQIPDEDHHSGHKQKKTSRKEGTSRSGGDRSGGVIRQSGGDPRDGGVPDDFAAQLLRGGPKTDDDERRERELAEKRRERMERIFRGETTSSASSSKNSSDSTLFSEVEKILEESGHRRKREGPLLLPPEPETGLTWREKIEVGREKDLDHDRSPQVRKKKSSRKRSASAKRDKSGQKKSSPNYRAGPPSRAPPDSPKLKGGRRASPAQHHDDSDSSGTRRYKKLRSKVRGPKNPLTGKHDKSRLENSPRDVIDEGEDEFFLGEFPPKPLTNTAVPIERRSITSGLPSLPRTKMLQGMTDETISYWERDKVLQQALQEAKLALRAINIKMPNAPR